MDTCSSVMEEFFPGENMEGGDDVSSEWLSIFVEDCLSGSTSYTNPLPTPTTTTTTTTTKSNSQSPPPPFLKLPTPQNTKHPLRSRPKRAKTTSRTHPYDHPTTFHVDPPLLHQTHWLAESELIFPKKEPEENAPALVMGGGGGGGGAGAGAGGGEEKGEGKMEKEGGQTRRCTHCLSQRTPQWRTGPLGPKTLCNACGVRFKSGRLLPEYRPAKSPTFVSYKHSNSHKKVLEIRTALLSSHSN